MTLQLYSTLLRVLFRLGRPDKEKRWMERQNQRIRKKSENSTDADVDDVTSSSSVLDVVGGELDQRVEEDEASQPLRKEV